MATGTKKSNVHKAQLELHLSQNTIGEQEIKTSLTKTHDTMPITTITTTVVTMTTMVATGTCVTTSKNTTIMTVDHEDVRKKEPKRKQPEEMEDDHANKKRNVDLNSENVMARMFQELVGMKTMIGDRFGNLENKVEMIHEENKNWKEKLVTIERDICDLKESVEMAYNLIKDESAKRTQDVSELRTAIADHGTENMGNTKLIKSHSSELRDVKSNLTAISDKLENLSREQQSCTGPVKELKQAVEEMTGTCEFPIAKTIVAQRVWYEENEDLQKVASTIINKALNLPNVTIVRVTRKSG